MSGMLCLIGALENIGFLAWYVFCTFSCFIAHFGLMGVLIFSSSNMVQASVEYHVHVNKLYVYMKQIIIDHCPPSLRLTIHKLYIFQCLGEVFRK